MGLDITHCKATLERPEHSSPSCWPAVYRESFEGFNVPFSHFDRYVQEVDCPRIIETAILVKQEKYLQEVKDWFSEDRFRIIFSGNDLQISNQLIDFERDKKLSNYNKSFHDTEKWKVLDYYEILKKEGFYYQECGEQRKGVNDRFWDRFRSTEISDFALKEDFEFAWSCVDYYWKNDTEEIVRERKENFKKNFIDNFELGASFLSLSY